MTALRGTALDRARRRWLHGDMKWATAFGLALTHALSWVVICLSTCLMPAVAKHACCSNEAAVRSVERDCCSVAPTVPPDSAPAADAPPMIARADARVVTALRLPARFDTAVRAAASPPLTLRI